MVFLCMLVLHREAVDASIQKIAKEVFDATVHRDRRDIRLHKVSDVMGELNFVNLQAAPAHKIKQRIINQAIALHVCFRMNSLLPEDLKALKLDASVSPEQHCHDLVNNCWDDSWTFWETTQSLLLEFMEMDRLTPGLEILVKVSFEKCKVAKQKNSFEMMYLNSAAAAFAVKRNKSIDALKWAEEATKQLKSLHPKKPQSLVFRGFAMLQKDAETMFKYVHEMLDMWVESEEWMRQILRKEVEMNKRSGIDEPKSVDAIAVSEFTYGLLWVLAEWGKLSDPVDTSALMRLFDASEEWGVDAGLDARRIKAVRARWFRDYSELNKDMPSSSSEGPNMKFQKILQSIIRGTRTVQEFEPFLLSLLQEDEHKQYVSSIVRRFASYAMVLGPKTLIQMYIMNENNVRGIVESPEQLSKTWSSLGFVKKSQLLQDFSSTNDVEAAMMRVAAVGSFNFDHDYQASMRGLISQALFPEVYYPDALGSLSVLPALMLSEDAVPLLLVYGSQGMLLQLVSDKCSHSELFSQKAEHSRIVQRIQMGLKKFVELTQLTNCGNYWWFGEPQIDDDLLELKKNKDRILKWFKVKTKNYPLDFNLRLLKIAANVTLMNNSIEVLSDIKDLEQLIPEHMFISRKVLAFFRLVTTSSAASEFKEVLPFFRPEKLYLEAKEAIDDKSKPVSLVSLRAAWELLQFIGTPPCAWELMLRAMERFQTENPHDKAFAVEIVMDILMKFKLLEFGDSLISSKLMLDACESFFTRVVPSRSMVLRIREARDEMKEENDSSDRGSSLVPDLARVKTKGTGDKLVKCVDMPTSDEHSEMADTKEPSRIKQNDLTTAYKEKQQKKALPEVKEREKQFEFQVSWKVYVPRKKHDELREAIEARSSCFYSWDGLHRCDTKKISTALSKGNISLWRLKFNHSQRVFYCFGEDDKGDVHVRVVGSEKRATAYRRFETEQNLCNADFSLDKFEEVDPVQV